MTPPGASSCSGTQLHAATGAAWPGVIRHRRPRAVIHSSVERHVGTRRAVRVCAQKGQQGAAGPFSSMPGWRTKTASTQQGVAYSSLDMADARELPAPLARAQARRERLAKLIEVRSLYRDFMRAKALLRVASPVYTPLPAEEAGACEVDLDASEAAARERECELAEAERRKEAVEVVAEMQLTANQLKSGLRSLPAGFGVVFVSGDSSAGQQYNSETVQQYEEQIRETARQFAAQLRVRVAQEMEALPFPSLAQAQAAMDARNARYSRAYSNADVPYGPALYGGTGGSSGSSSSTSGGGSPPPVGPTEAAQQQLLARLGQAEKVAEQFVANRIKPVLRKAREGELVDMVKETGDYLKGLWLRLNGAGSRLREPALSPDLPLPASAKKETELAISELSLQLDVIEGKLREAARAREAKLRRVRTPENRASMPLQLKMMDEEVLRLSRSLAVLMLQMELEYAYSALEDEALDVAGSDVDELLQRQGSTAELRLLVAEYVYLDEQLAALAALLGIDGTSASSAASHSAGAAGSAGASSFHAAGGSVGGAAFHGASGSDSSADAGASGSSNGSSSSSSLVTMVQVGGVPVSVEDLLVALANEVPDMRQRVGVADQVVFGGQGFSFTKARLQVRDALDKVREAITFLTRGVKLLGSDISTATRLFGKAAVGGTLKPREVSALRRTARDILTFIPFTIILIIPLTPLGHVLVFGFIQTYFPSFFPSCFTSKRQELMVRYEELERQLLQARTTAEQVEEEAELVRAAAAKATKLSRSTKATSSSSSRNGSGASGRDAGSNGARGDAAAASVNGEAAGQKPPGAGKAVAVAAAEAPQPGRGGANGGAPPAARQQRLPDLSSLNEAAVKAVAKQTEQVKALEERIAAVLDDVTLGDSGDESAAAGGQGAQGGEPGNGSSSSSNGLLKKRAARK